jgi:hypothetical protein
MSSRLVPAISSLQPLVGTWSLTVTMPDVPAFKGKSHFEPIAEGAFLLMKTSVEGKGFPDSLCVFGGDEDERFLQMLYNDSRGVSRVYACVMNGRRWEMWRRTAGSSQRFKGQISESGDQIEARWEASSDGIEWALDFDMLFERNKAG